MKYTQGQYISSLGSRIALGNKSSLMRKVTPLRQSMSKTIGVNMVDSGRSTVPEPITSSDAGAIFDDVTAFENILNLSGASRFVMTINTNTSRNASTSDLYASSRNKIRYTLTWNDSSEGQSYTFNQYIIHESNSGNVKVYWLDAPTTLYNSLNTGDTLVLDIAYY